MMQNDTGACLAVESWPQMDQEAWAAARASGDFFSDGGHAAQYRANTVRICVRSYGRYLMVMTLLGRLKDTDASIGVRFSVENLRLFIDHETSRLAPSSMSILLRALSSCVKVMDPLADRDPLLRASRYWKRIDRRKHSRSELIDPPVLLELGITLMDEADSQELPPVRRSLRYRDGLLIAFLALCPLRLENLRSLTEGVHFHLGGNCELRIGAAHMKGRRDLETVVPQFLMQRIERYWHTYRKVLAKKARPGESALWLTQQGKQMAAASVYHCVKSMIKERTGRQFTPHMFRHSVASYLAEVSPTQARIAMGVLGHSDIRTTQTYYDRGRRWQAMCRYQRLVRTLIRAG
jgi:integrase